MIDPASIGDWIQAAVLGALLAGATAMFTRILRMEERGIATVVAPTEQQRAPRAWGGRRSA